MRRLRHAISFILVGLASAVAEAQPNPWNLGVNCYVGAFRACVSVVLWTEPNATTGHSELLVRMANVQGTPGYTDLVPIGLMGYDLNRINVTPATPSFRDALMSGGFTTGNVREQCSVTTGTCAPGPFTGFIPIDPFGVNNADGTRTIVGDIWGGSSGGVIWGCDVAHTGEMDLDSRYSTCGGSATWRISLAHAGSDLTYVTQSSVTLTFRQAESGAVVSCETGVDCVTVTPEPGTLILLGSGLAAIAGARSRRRKAG
jgi:hypothetical protein